MCDGGGDDAGSRERREGVALRGGGVGVEVVGLLGRGVAGVVGRSAGEVAREGRP